MNLTRRDFLKRSGRVVLAT
ncbi:MAG: twin-arginine translocation signal domain-containing protein, partial [Deltaproteobacteria bacterium]|nr:twin-arginine translocation signal domain-containing protein [Deltaproteobacteria bacterium]